MMKIPRLSSLRLALRPYQETDFGAFALLNADPSVRQHVGGPQNHESSARLFERFTGGNCRTGNEVWAVVHKSNDVFIGHCWFAQEDADDPEMGFLVPDGPERA